MSPSLAKPCASPGCPALIPRGTAYCDGHRDKEWKSYDEARGTSAKRGYDARWRKLRAIKARADPLCEPCTDEGRTTPLDLVHHKVPVAEDPSLRLVWSNLQSICNEHHQRVHAEMQRGGCP